MKWTSVLCSALAASLMSAAAARAETYRISGEGTVLTVRTQHMEARFEGPEMVGLVNLTTGETYTRSRENLWGGLAQVKIRNAGSIRPKDGRWRQMEGSYGAIYEAGVEPAKGGTYRLWVSAQNGELIINCDCNIPTAGVRAVAWGISGLNLKVTSAIVPALGGRILNSASTGSSESYEYPSQWEAQFVVVNGKKGSALIYSTDQNARFKKLSYRRAVNAYELTFETENPAPFDNLRAAKSAQWRIACLTKDWRTAASTYVQNMRTLGDLYNRPKVVSDQKWTKDIRGVVRVGGNYSDIAILDELKKHVEPSKTLLYFHDWRKDGYDINYPDYTGRPGLAQFTKHAQDLGFKVMYHVDLPGVSPSHPAYERLKQYHVKDAASLNPIGWLWDKDMPQRFAFINPASSEFRKIFVDAMKSVVRDYKPDAIHLDVSAPMWNDGNGLIEGMNYCQGSIKLHKELLEALPELVLGGESLNELISPFEHFVQRWAWPCSLDPHPICDYLFGEDTVSYGYLGQPNPDDAPDGFLTYVKVYENQGVLPSMVVDSVDDMAPNKNGAMRWFNVIRAWQQHDLRPDWQARWGESVLYSLKGADGVRAVIERTAQGVRMTCGKKLLYERVEGVSRVKTSGHISGHPGYAPGEAFGLDPSRSYWLQEGEPDFKAPHISALQGDMVIKASRVQPDLVIFELQHRAGATIYDLAENVGMANIGVLMNDQRLPQERGATFRKGDAQVAGELVSGIMAHPPWQPLADGSSGAGCTSAIYSVKIPPAAEGSCSLVFSAGINDMGDDSDGVTFRVNVNRAEVYNQHVLKGAPAVEASIYLSGYAGRTIDIELITDPGPEMNTSWDHAVWGEPRVIINRPQQQCRAEMALVKKPKTVITPPAETGAAQMLSLKAGVIGGEVLVDGEKCSLPCNIYFPYIDPQPVELPFDLTLANYITDLDTCGSRAPDRAWGCGLLENVKINGDARRALNAHPPSQGRAVLTWLLQMPDDEAALVVTAGVKPNAATQGLGFDIRINGELLWHRSATSPCWIDARLDLSDYKGKMIVLELVTDAMGDDFCDWATWVSPQLVPLSN